MKTFMVLAKAIFSDPANVIFYQRWKEFLEYKQQDTSDIQNMINVFQNNKRLLNVNDLWGEHRLCSRHLLRPMSVEALEVLKIAA